MATNEILPFAGTDTGTNLLTQSDYNADAQRLVGNQPGIARQQLVNKVLRQTSLVSAAIAKFIADNQSNNVVDSATPTNLASWFSLALGSIASLPTAVAGGTANALTADFTPDVGLTDGKTIIVRAASANTTSTPTLSTDGTTALTIVKGSNGALVAGDIAGAGHWLELQYDNTLNKWVLLNPANGVSPTISIPVGAIVDFPYTATPVGYLKANGAAISRTTYANLFAVIGTGYGVGDGSTTFNLPDYRAEFRRGLDDGRGIDSGRGIGTSQSGDNAAHSHTVTDPGHAHSYSGPSGSTFGQPSGGAPGFTTLSTASATTGITIASSGSEARPRNVAVLTCIKY